MSNDLVAFILWIIAWLTSGAIIYYTGYKRGYENAEDKIAERTYMENRRKANHR